MELSLLSLDSGGTLPHPLAAESTWLVPPAGTHTGRSWLDIIGAHVYGPYIAWRMPWHGGDILDTYVQVRNWQTGCEMLVRRSHYGDWRSKAHRAVTQAARVPYGSSMTFIDTSYMAMTVEWTGDQPNRANDGRNSAIAIYRFRAEDGQRAGYVTTLQLPPGTKASLILESWAPSPPTPPRSAVFWADPAQRLIVLRLTISYVGSTKTRNGLRLSLSSEATWYSNHILLLIPCATFRKLLSPTGRKPNVTSAPPHQWSEWGPDGSVLIQYDGFRNREQWGHEPKYFFPFGSRLTFLSPSPKGPRLTTVDVNPLSKLHAHHPGCAKEESLASVEHFNHTAQAADFKTTYPRAYHVGPIFPDARQALAISQHPSGYTVCVSPDCFICEVCLSIYGCGSCKADISTN